MKLMIIDITDTGISVREGHDLTRMHVESTNRDANVDAARLEDSGLGHLVDDTAVMLNTHRLYQLVTETVMVDLQPGWDAMLTYAESKGWTAGGREFVRAHLERASVPAGRAAPPADPAHFRSVLSHFATGVTIVTANTPDGPVGFSCQSFSSLSLDPPMIVILPGRSSTSWPRIQETGRFCVNVLAADQQALADRFARSGGDKFTGVQWSPGPLGNPHLEGVCAWIDCEINAIHPGGDHLVVLGDVRSLEAASSAEPLVFHLGRYAQVR